MRIFLDDLILIGIFQIHDIVPEINLKIPTILYLKGQQ